MPAVHHQDSPTPGESPGGRLSRWFSIRYKSQNYDVGAREGRHSTSSSSIDAPDATTAIENLSPKISSSVSCGGNVTLKELPENDEDLVVPNPLDLLLSSGRSNKKALANSLLILPTLPPAPPGITPEQLKRRHIVEAIVHSENSYVATLQRLVNDYKKPLENSSPPILNSTKTAILFHRLPDILSSHKLFRSSLIEYARNWDKNESLGDVFLKAFSQPQVLEIYSGFINNFSAAMELAKMEAKRKSALADFFKVKQISAHDRLSFFGLMVKPVQRFPQFILFLQDLLKNTPQGHHDRTSLQLALTQLESLAEMLNERKREAEQYQAFKEMLGHISGTFNTRSLSSTEGCRHRYLLREDNVTQMEFNQQGFIVKSKQRRLLLLNDKVICVSVAPKQSYDFGATEKLSFKWMYPVTDVEIVDNSTSATLSRILTAGLNRGGSLKSNSSSCNTSAFDSSTLPPPSSTMTNTPSPYNSSTLPLTNGTADNLCNEMSTLMHDFEVISRIHELVGSLKSNYTELNTNVTRNVLKQIQNSIQRKDEEMAWVDSCCLQIVAKNKSGKEETLTFQTENPMVKKQWITELRLAQLALDPNNSPAWEIPGNGLNEKKGLMVTTISTKMPLFVKAQPICKVTQLQTEVRCGCYYTIANDTKSTTSRRRFKQLNYVWVCTSDGNHSHVAVLSQHHQQAGNLKDVGSFNIQSTQITYMEHVKGLSNCTTKEEFDSLLGDLVWMGTDSKKIFIYSAKNPEKEERLGECSVDANVTKILYHFDTVFVALKNSTILIYRRAFDGVWLLKEPEVVKLGDSGLSVSTILPINSSIYASCGSNIFIISPRNGEIQKSFEIQQNVEVNLMAHSGIGLWIALKNSSVLCLYDIETFKHLQNINIADSVLKDNQKTMKKSSSIYVTALMAYKGLLWVGTNVGIAVTIPLPRLGGLPIISGGVNMSCHAHFGPVTFLLPLVPKTSNSYKPIQKVTLPPIPMLERQKSVIGEDLHLPAIDADENTVILRRKDFNDSNTSSEFDAFRSPKRLEKQNSMDHNLTLKLKEKLTLSPAAMRRRRTSREPSDASSVGSCRMSKTLPRGNYSNTNSLTHSDYGGHCDVFGLYGKLIYVKEDYDANETTQSNLIDAMYEGMRRSDPELAAIPAKVSTLDRRLRMKTSRPRSLDLSNWSVESKSSSLCTSSGSEESMGLRYHTGRSVSRNSSSASHKGASDLGNISEMMSAEIHEEKLTKDEETQQMAPAAATLKRQKNKANAAANSKNSPNSEGPTTVITLMGGRGYWKHVWYNSSGTSPSTGKNNSSSNSRFVNSNDAHIVIWEKKL